MVPFSPAVASLISPFEFPPLTLAGRIAFLDRKAAAEFALYRRAAMARQFARASAHKARFEAFRAEAARFRAIAARAVRPPLPAPRRPVAPAPRPVAPPPMYAPSVKPAPLFVPGVYGPALTEQTGPAEAAPEVMEPSTVEQVQTAQAEAADGKMPAALAPWYTRPLGVGAIVFGGVVAVIALRKKGKKSKKDKAAV